MGSPTQMLLLSPWIHIYEINYRCNQPSMYTAQELRHRCPEMWAWCPHSHYCDTGGHWQAWPASMWSHFPCLIHLKWLWHLSPLFLCPSSHQMQLLWPRLLQQPSIWFSGYQSLTLFNSLSLQAIRTILLKIWSWVSCPSKNLQYREMAQWLIALDALPKDLNFVPSSQIGRLAPLITPVPDYQRPLLDSMGTNIHMAHTHAFTHAHTINKHKYKSYCSQTFNGLHYSQEHVQCNSPILLQ